MAESSVNVTPGAGGPDIDLFTIDNGKSRQVIVIGDAVDSIDVAPVDSVNGLAVDNKTLAPLAATSTHQTDGLQKTQVVGSTGNVTAVSAAGGLSVDITGVGAAALGQEVMAASLPVVIASDQSAITVTANIGTSGALATAANQTNGTQITQVSNQVQLQPSPLTVSSTAAISTGVTATLPAVSGQFHYITSIIITQYAGAVVTGTATPVIVNTTNLPGSLSFTFPSALQVIGTIQTEKVYTFESPLKSLVINTATTIVAPTQTSAIWRINILYYTAP